MIVAAAALTVLLTTCAPNVAPRTMAAIVAVESGGDPYALNDNTTRRSYAPRDYAGALATAKALIRQGDRVDVGIAQVNSSNFAAFHTTACEMLDPCANVRVASRILAENYATARAIFSEPGRGLWHAISAYNTGSLYAGKAYVDRVVAAATRTPLVPTIDLLRHGRAPESTAAVIHAAPKRMNAIRIVPPADCSDGTPNAQGLVIGISAPSHARNARAR